MYLPQQKLQLPLRHEQDRPQGLRTKTVENAKGDGGPESGVQSTALALAADGAFDLAASEHFGREFAHQGEVVRGGFVAHLAVVLMVGDVEQMMTLIFHRPMIADEPAQLGGADFEAAEVVVGLHSGLVRSMALAHRLAPHADHTLQPRPFPGFGPPVQLPAYDDFPLLVAPPVLLAARAHFTALHPGAFVADFLRGCRGPLRLEVGDDILMRFFFVGLEREDVVSSFVLDLAGDVGMTAHGVNGDDGSLELEFGQQTRQGFEFVAFLGADFVADAQTCLADPGAQDVQGAFASDAVLGSTTDFAVNGDLLAIEFADPQLHEFEQGVGLQGEGAPLRNGMNWRSQASCDWAKWPMSVKSSQSLTMAHRAISSTSGRECSTRPRAHASGRVAKSSLSRMMLGKEACPSAAGFVEMAMGSVSILTLISGYGILYSGFFAV